MSQEFESNGFSDGNSAKGEPAADSMGGEGMLIESNYDKVTDNFDDMNLAEDLLRGIYAYGFEKPSAIQQRAIVPCIAVSFRLLSPSRSRALIVPYDSAYLCPMSQMLSKTVTCVLTSFLLFHEGT